MLKYLEALDELPKELKSPLVKVLELFKEEVAETLKRSDFERFEKATEENFNRVWKSIEELTEAQKRTEREVRTLASELKDTKRMVGGLSDTVGYTLENSAYKGLPSLLMKDLGIKVEGRLMRKYIEHPDGRYDEINIYGKAKRNGKDVWVLGEAKVRMSKKEINEFLKMVERLDRVIKGEKILIGVAHTIMPEVEKYARVKGIKIYWSYEF
ncbi:MAG: chordopoxvirus fusion protein [Nitrospirae bacterium]|nr:chordopoxvirus fusion protein [Nitrospirota bacterium]